MTQEQNKALHKCKIRKNTKILSNLKIDKILSIFLFFLVKIFEKFLKKLLENAPIIYYNIVYLYKIKEKMTLWTRTKALKKL